MPLTFTTSPQSPFRITFRHGLTLRFDFDHRAPRRVPEWKALD